MKESVRNSRRGPAHSWWVVLGLVVLLTACTVEESDGPVESDEAVEPCPVPSAATGRSLAWWTDPARQSRCRRRVRPRAGPWMSRTSGQIRIRTHTTTQQPSGRPWTRPNRVTRSCCRPARMTCAPLTRTTSRRTSCCAAAWTCAARVRRAPCC